jgi:hypothetical protein
MAGDETGALVLLFTAHDTPVYYATNGELANLHHQPVSERWASEGLE